MTGVDILIGGGILMCNVGLLAYLLKSDKRVEKASTPQSDGSEKQSENLSKKEDKDNSNPPVAPSAFDVDSFLTMVVDELKTELPVMFKAAIGEVYRRDVEFAPEKPSTPITQLNSKETEDAFNTDIRDVEPDEISAPAASGVSMDEMADAIETATDDNASPEQKAEAGKVLSSVEDTNLMDALNRDDEIGRRIKVCLTLALQAEVSGIKSKPKASSANHAVKTHSKRKEVKFDFDSMDYDNFNPEDLLKK